MGTQNLRNNILDDRRSGVLLHITSLPGSGAQGCLNAEAFHFIDFLAAAGFGAWQILPIVPTHDDLSPYNSISSFAGNPNLLDFDDLSQRGWITRGEEEFDKADNALWRNIYKQYLSTEDESDIELFNHFVEQQNSWLTDYALYLLIKDKFSGAPWYEWPKQYRRRQVDALTQFLEKNHEAVHSIYFQQYLFYRQWQNIKDHAREKNVKIIGDMPIFVAHDSVDCWCNPQMFKLDKRGMPTVVAGVPPDYFSETGQRWGNPCYDWSHMQKNNFFWLKSRLDHHFTLFDITRIDHFRGFAACWEIPADDEFAINGRWQVTPGKKLFNRLLKDYTSLPIIAEDLGIITEDVEQLRDNFGFPGMKILQFAFDGNADNPYLPHQHISNSVVYTGTHDNDTTVGWYETLDENTQDHIMEYFSYPAERMPWPMGKSALASVAKLAIIPMQDLLELDSSRRMNTPGTVEDNWKFRFQWQELSENLATRLYAMNERYGRITGR